MTDQGRADMTEQTDAAEVEGDYLRGFRDALGEVGDWIVEHPLARDYLAAREAAAEARGAERVLAAVVEWMPHESSPGYIHARAIRDAARAAAAAARGAEGGGEDGCPACGHPRRQHVGRWCRVPTGAVNREGRELICCCEAVAAAERGQG